MGKYATVLSLKSDQNLEGLVMTAYKNRDGNLSILIVNNREEAVNVDISINNLDKKQPFNLYQVTENLVKVAGFN